MRRGKKLGLRTSATHVVGRCSVLQPKFVGSSPVAVKKRKLGLLPLYDEPDLIPYVHESFPCKE